jgi:hypothetical protein
VAPQGPAYDAITVGSGKQMMRLLACISCMAQRADGLLAAAAPAAGRARQRRRRTPRRSSASERRGRSSGRRILQIAQHTASGGGRRCSRARRARARRGTPGTLPACAWVAPGRRLPPKVRMLQVFAACMPLWKCT